MFPTFLRFSYSAVLFGLFLAPLPSHSQEEVTFSESESVEAERDWLEFYYEKPTPGEFVDQIRQYSKEGILLDEGARPALIGFLSQVMRQNRGLIAEWYGELRSLSPEELQVIHTAMLYSRTSEADTLLKLAFGEELEKQKEELPKILELQLDRQQTLDMLWGFFYATGSENAIRRVVACFQFADQPVSPEDADLPPNYRPLYSQLPDAAAWSLLSNSIRHPKVRKICRELGRDEDELTPTEQRLLKEKVLDRLDLAEEEAQKEAGR